MAETELTEAELMESIEELRSSQQRMSEEFNRKFVEVQSRIVHQMETQIDSIKLMTQAFLDKIDARFESPTESSEIALGNDYCNPAMADANAIAEVIGVDKLLQPKESEGYKSIISTNYETTIDKNVDQKEEEVEFSSIKARIQFMEEDEELFLSKQKDVKIANQLFDKMPSRTPVVELQQCETTLDKNAEQNEDCEVFVELPKPSPRDVIDEKEATITKMAASSENSAYSMPSFSSPNVVEDRDKALHASIQASGQSAVQASVQAFKQSQIESISAMIQSVFAQNKLKHAAHKVFEERSPPKSLCRAETQGAEGVSEEKSSDFLDASSLIATNADFCSMLQAINSVREDVGGLGDSENTALKTFDNVIESIQESEFSSFEAGIQLVEKAEQSFPSTLEVVELAYETFDEMTDLVPTARHSFSSVSLIRNERNDDSVLHRADYCKFDEVLGPFSVKHNTRIDIQEVLEPPTFALLKILGCDFIISNGLKQDFDKMASNLNVELWVGMVPMFVFDPGGSSLYLRGCSSLKLNGDKQNCDFWINEFTSTKAELCWTNLYSCNENSPVYSTFGECKNALYFTDHDALFLFDPGGSYYLLRAWNWNDAFVICEKQQGRNMTKKSGIYNIEVDQHNQVGDLSCTYVGIFEFGGPFGKLQITCKYIQGLFHAWGILEFKLMADSIAYPSLISSPWLPGSRSPLTKQGIGAVIDKTGDIGLDSWKEQHEDTLVSLVALGFRDSQNATKTFFGKVGGGLGVVMVFFSTGLAITNLLYNNFEKCPPLAPVYESTRYGDSFTAAASQIGMQKGSWELSVTVTGNLCVWTSHCSFHYHEERFLRGHKNVVLVRSTFLENFVWDPGLCAVLVHILEDKDVFEGVGKDDTHEYYIGDIWILHPWGIGIVLMKQMGFLNGNDGKGMMIYCEGLPPGIKDSRRKFIGLSHSLHISLSVVSLEGFSTSLRSRKFLRGR